MNLYITGCTGSITSSGCLHDILMTIFLKLLSINLTFLKNVQLEFLLQALLNTFQRDNLTMLHYIRDVAEELPV